MFGARVLGGEEGRVGQQYVGVGYVWCVFKCALLGRGTRTVWEKREKETNAHSAGEREGEEYAQCGKGERRRGMCTVREKRVGDRSRNRVFRDRNSFLVPTESVAIPVNIFGGVYVPGKYGKRVGFSRMLLQRGNVFIFKNNNCIISNLLELLFVHNYII